MRCVLKMVGVAHPEVTSLLDGLHHIYFDISFLKLCLTFSFVLIELLRYSKCKFLSLIQDVFFKEFYSLIFDPSMLSVLWLKALIIDMTAIKII